MKRFTFALFTAVQLIIVSLLLFAAGSTDYYIKRDQLYPNTVYAAAGLVLTVLLCLVIKISGGRLEGFLTRHLRPVIFFTLLLFFLISAALDISGFFYSDWDPMAVLYAAFELVQGKGEILTDAYLSNHPNNLLLVWIYSMVLKAAGMAGQGSVLAIVVFQCIISTLTAFIVWRIMSDIYIGSRVMPYVGLILYEVWIGLSPWFIVTYSDQAGIIFPVLILRLSQRISQSRDRGRLAGSNLLWGAVSLVAGTGYFIKPQIVIAYIAVLLFNFLDCLDREVKHTRVLKNGGNKAGLMKRGAVIAVISGVCFILSFFLVRGIVFPSMRIDIDADRSFGMAHYFMMGLNRETDGVYSDEDTLYTDSFDSPEKKREADMELAWQRIREYGPAGIAGHAGRKTLVNYNDGLFSWGVDGRFFAGREAEDLGNVEKTPLTDAVWSFILPEGADHGKYSSMLQMFWIMILLMCIVSGGVVGGHLLREGKKPPGGGIPVPDDIYIVMLALTGLFFFELLFEAKARYLFIYTPYYLILSVYGLFAVLKRLKWV